jgi:VWFA-related protein
LAVFVLGAPWLAGVHAGDRTELRFAQQQAPVAAAPTIQVYSRETIVDVTITDKDGKPVHGLTRDDFTVKEDGKPQAIKSFAEFGNATPIQPPPQLPPNTYTNLQPPSLSGATNILWLDFTNSAPVLSSSCCAAGPKNLPATFQCPSVETWGTCDLALALARQRHTKEYVEKYLHTMPAGTRAAVLGTWYPGSLHVLQGVTADRDLLSAAVDTMPYDQDGMVMLTPSTVPAMDAPEDWCAQQERRNRMTLEALQQMAADLAQIKGRKNLLWYNMRIWTLTTPERPACLTDPRLELQKAYALLAVAQVTVFPISVRGVEGPSTKQAYDMLAAESIAESTGGKAFYNSNDLGSLTAQAMSAGVDYYTLSYVPPGNGYDGRHHSIKIVAAKPGVMLAYRDEYYAEDPRAIVPTSGLTLASVSDAGGGLPDIRKEMTRAMPTSQQFLFDVHVEPNTEPAKPSDPAVMGALDAKLKGRPLARYSFQFEFPGHQIAFTEGQDDTYKGGLEFDLVAYDGDGNVLTSLRQAIQIHPDMYQLQDITAAPFHYSEQLDLPAGALFVRVGVLDRTANKMGTLEIPITVAKPVHNAAR